MQRRLLITITRENTIYDKLLKLKICILQEVFDSSGEVTFNIRHHTNYDVKPKEVSKTPYENYCELTKGMEIEISSDEETEELLIPALACAEEGNVPDDEETLKYALHLLLL